MTVPSPNEVTERLTRAADLLMDYDWKHWWYGDSVGFQGLLAASELLGEQRWRAFAHGYVKAWAQRSEPRRESDDSAPGQAICEIAKSTEDQQILGAAISLGEYLIARRTIRRLPVNIEVAQLRPHPTRRSIRRSDLDLLLHPGAGAFVDFLQMGPPLFAQLGATTLNRRFRDRALREALAYVDALQDPSTGVFHHFVLEKRRHPYGLGWGRGQGWALLGLLDVYELSPAKDARREAVGRAAQGLANAMLGLQCPDGSWWAVVHEPASGPETSTGAFMAAGFWRGIRLGLLPSTPFADAAAAAWGSTWRAVDDQGLLTGVSEAVYCSTELEHYFHLPSGGNVPWGQGPLLMAALEQRRHLGVPTR